MEQIYTYRYLNGFPLRDGEDALLVNWCELTLNIHSPHPSNKLKRYQVQAVRDFLLRAGINDEI